MKSAPTFLFSLIILLIVTTAKSELLNKRIIFPIPLQPSTTSTSSTDPTIPIPTDPAIPTTTVPTVVETTTILSTSYLPGIVTTIVQVGETSSNPSPLPSTTVEVIKTVAPAATDSTDNPNTSGSDSYYEGNGNSLIVEGIGIKMSIAAVFLNVFYVVFA